MVCVMKENTRGTVISYSVTFFPISMCSDHTVSQDKNPQHMDLEYPYPIFMMYSEI